MKKRKRKQRKIRNIELRKEYKRIYQKEKKYRVKNKMKKQWQ